MDVRFIYRLMFKKAGLIRFIGHLDLMNVFQRAFRRAELPVMYSTGFNPHQRMSFALPLALGMEGLGECLEVELAEALDTDIIMQELNSRLPEGLDVYSCRLLQQGEPKGAAAVWAAKYIVTLDNRLTLPDLTAAIQAIMQADEIVLDKSTKSGTKPVNIRPLIYELEAGANNSINTTLAAGSTLSLKPSVVAELLCKYAGVEWDGNKVMYVRECLFMQTDEGLSAL